MVGTVSSSLFPPPPPVPACRGVRGSLAVAVAGLRERVALPWGLGACLRALTLRDPDLV